MDPQRHEMVLEKTYTSGAEDWYCPTCGRRMAITWEPWKKIVLEPGDMYASHSASKGGLQLGTTQGNEIEQPSPIDLSTDDPYLAPWIQWLDKVDLDDLANGDD